MSSGNPMDTSLEDARFANVASMSDDWYHGHKVVAMPSSAFGGMSIREVVSSRNESEQANNPNSRPRRSNSLGGQPIRQSRDIIQDVYDRMGVSYTRGINYEAPPPAAPASSTGGYEDPHIPMVQIQTTPSFSEVSDFSAGSGSNINSVQPGGRPSSGKIKDKFSGRYRAAAAMTRTTPDRGQNRPVDPAVQNLNRGRATEPRGRAQDSRMEEAESDGRRRARSLSRGRSVQGRWPPAKDQVQTMDNTPVGNSKDIPVGYNTPLAETIRTANPPPPPQTTPPQQQQQQQPQPPSSPNRPKSPLKRSHSFDARPQYGGGFRTPQTTAAMHNKVRTLQTVPPPMDGGGGSSIREEKKESDDRSAASEASGAEEVSTPTLPSIKDRISAFAGKSNSVPSQRNAGRRNTLSGGSYGKPAAPPPPKVDIYQQANGRAHEDFMASHSHPDDPYEEGAPEMAAEEYGQQPGGPPEPSVVPPSAAATAAADAAAKYMRPSPVVPTSKQKASRNSTGSARSSIANSYLSSVQSNTGAPSNRSTFQSQQQMSDASATSNHQDEMYSVGQNGSNSNDGNSVGAPSTASYGDARTNRVRRQSWQKQAPYNSQSVGTKNNGGNPVNTVNSGGSDISVELIERMVDERVQVQLREVEARMEGLLRRWMDSMNSKITTRLDSMEKSIKDSLPRHEI